MNSLITPKVIEEYKKNGIVVLSQAIGDALVKDSVKDIWETIEHRLPWRKEYKDRWSKLHDSMKNDYWREVTKAEVTEAREIYPSMGGFGALNPPPFYHLKTQWELRQQPNIVEAFTKLLGADEVMVGFDRISFKYPGMGENEFAHWDSNPYLWKDETLPGIQGIVALSDTSFFAIPGTHTNEFRDSFIKDYPWNNRNDQYHIKKKGAGGAPQHDPQGLLTKTVEYPLKKGDLVIWSDRLLHEARINKKKSIRYAYYLSYFPKNQPNETIKKVFKNAKLDYYEDRLQSFKTGKNPYLYPSGTKIELSSAAVWMYYPNKLNEFCSRFKEVASEEREYESGKKKGQKVRVPINYEPLSIGQYSPPELSELGRKILGV